MNPPSPAPPSGISWRPEIPRAARVRRAIGLAAGVIFAAIGIAVIYSINAHGVIASAPRDAKPKAVRPASDEAKRIVMARPQAQPGPAGGILGVRQQPSAPQPAQPPQSVMAARQQQPGQPYQQQPVQVQYAQAQPPAYYQAPSQGAPADPSAKAEHDALWAPAAVGGNWVQSAQGGSPAMVPPPPPMSDQDQKEDFLRRRPATTSILAGRTPAHSKYEIRRGWYIPAELVSQMNSDLPGSVTGRVRENVFDTPTGKYLLIPQGALLVGTYDSHIAYGQSRMQALWTSMVFPDGSTLELEGMAGQDGIGQAGYRDKVDNHYKKILGAVLISSAFDALSALAQNRRGTVLGYPSASEIASSSAATNMSQQMAEITRRNLNIQPTLVIRPGFLFNVFVSRDIIFEGPYKPLRSITDEEQATAQKASDRRQ